MKYISSYETELGIGAVVATEAGVSRVLLPHEESDVLIVQNRLSGGKPSPLTEDVALLLKRYFRGEPQLFDFVPVDLVGMTAFRTRILQLVRTIPFGEVRSYCDVAIMAGVPRSARAIGGAMAANPVPVIIPCHRVVAANGKLTGYSAPGGLAIKERLLRMEGVEFKGKAGSQKTVVINKINQVCINK